ncbi:MAG TPA: tRNA (adenosine(37)-N6)-dimethylallyltransferase MiaA [Steroidobacteraceae bacterium]|nr:tRNA (adenosine(37)-N6)-dimethylallyltransferase MiaA [Steroidobacteraceae bacterium]HQZ80168.1 tRNA (adenosine(37)-N6)-dimethylallyltransferase MiaA [Steroidobacteraceae bacterium]
MAADRRPDTRAGPVIILTGPTGTGKSDWALSLAETLPVEIVSCDSAQVFRGLDIGTAKPDAATRARVPHHLLDLRDPAESYSAGEFVTDATATLRAILARGRLPVVVGGTMLYLRALLQGMAPLPTARADIRAQIDARAAREGWSTLHAELACFDPVAAARIHANDRQRIQRALEVFHATGTPISTWQSATGSAAGQFVFHEWALVPADRAVLHARITQRFHGMMAAGLLDEVRALHARPDLTPQHPAIRAVGYRQLWQHLAGDCSLEEAVARAIAATRQLAKRQLTWLKSSLSMEKTDPLAAQARAGWSARVHALWRAPVI